MRLHNSVLAGVLAIALVCGLGVLFISKADAKKVSSPKHTEKILL
jgi:hypothetical protein